MKLFPFFILLFLLSCGINQESVQKEAQIAFEHYMDSLNTAFIAKAKHEQDSIAQVKRNALKADSLREAFVQDSLRKAWIWRQKQKAAKENASENRVNE